MSKSKSRYRLRIEKGLCGQCGKPAGGKVCQDCRSKITLKTIKNKKRFKNYIDQLCKLADDEIEGN